MNTFKMILIIVWIIFSVPAGNISVAQTEEKGTPEWIRLVSENRVHLTGLVQICWNIRTDILIRVGNPTSERYLRRSDIWSGAIGGLYGGVVRGLYGVGPQ